MIIRKGEFYKCSVADEKSYCNGSKSIQVVNPGHAWVRYKCFAKDTVDEEKMMSRDMFDETFIHCTTPYVKKGEVYTTSLVNDQLNHKIVIVGISTCENFIWFYRQEDLTQSFRNIDRDYFETHFHQCDDEELNPAPLQPAAVQYKIVYQDTLPAVAYTVNEMMKDGWVPTGGVGGITYITGAPLFFQSMVKS